MEKHTAQGRIIFALDVADYAQAREWVQLLSPHIRWFKVGKELFTACGPAVVEMIREQGGQVFLDLKYHDIPNTVAQACRQACRLGVGMLNVHCLGGPDMLAAAAQAVADCEPRPYLLGVTVLTSASDATLEAVGMAPPVAASVERLALLAQRCGCCGVVASPREVAMLRRCCGPDFVLVTPGVRPLAAQPDDQKRTMTPAEAISVGVDYLVIGRPIAKAQDPLQAVADIGAEIAAAGG